MINAEFCAELLANLGLKVPTQKEAQASRPARRFPWVVDCFGQAALCQTAEASELLGKKPSKKIVEVWGKVSLTWSNLDLCDFRSGRSEKETCTEL